MNKDSPYSSYSLDHLGLIAGSLPSGQALGAIRQTLQQHQQTFPTQIGTTTAKPSARWVFQCFAGIHVLLIDSCREVILNYTEYHYQLLNLLGERYVRLYANSG